MSTVEGRGPRPSTTYPVTFDDVLAARDFLASHLRPTPLIRREAVSAALRVEALLKCESALPTAAFKVRGGLNLLGRDPTAKSGVIAASTGNHGQSLAYAGKRFGIPVTIVAPIGANPLKLTAMREHGATVIEHGADYDDAREECERRAAAERTRYVHSGNEPYLIAGSCQSGAAVAPLARASCRSDSDQTCASLVCNRKARPRRISAGVTGGRVRAAPSGPSPKVSQRGARSIYPSASSSISSMTSCS